MRNVMRGGWLLLAAAAVLLAALAAGVGAPDALAREASAGPPVCCIYVIF